MAGIRSFFIRILNTFRRSRLENDLHEQLETHREMIKDDLIGRGMEPEAATLAAKRAVGNDGLIREFSRDEMVHGMVEEAIRNVRYALRGLARNPGFAAMAILTLALGIGASTAIFSVVNAVLLRPLPYQNGGDLVLIRQHRPLLGIQNQAFSVKEIQDYREHVQGLDGLVEFHAMSFVLLGREQPSRVQTGVVSHNFFDVLGVKPLLGRSFLESDELHGAEAVLMLSYTYWQNEFGGDPAVVGKTFQMNDRPHTVIGVLPQIPQYPIENDVYMPTSACPFRSNPQFIDNRNARMMQVFARRTAGVPVERIQNDISAAASRMAEDYPASYPKSSGYQAVAVPLEEELTRAIRPTLWVLLCTAGFVLLIVCANVANLTLARALHRQREMTVRSAMGAGRRRLLAQLVTESTVLSMIGGLLGLLFAWLSMSLLTDFAARFTTRAHEINIDSLVLLVTFSVSLLTGVIFGSIPALGSRDNLATSLRAATARVSANRTSRRIRSGLIVAQVGVSFVLLIGAGLTLRSLVKLEGIDPGFTPADVLTFRVELNFTRYQNVQTGLQYYEKLLAELKDIPGVEKVAVASTFPLNQRQPFPRGVQVRSSGLTAALDPDAALPQADLQIASTDYFETIGVPLVQGRFFTDHDRPDSEPVVIINRAMASHFWPNEDPVGRQLSTDRGQTWLTVVGVVGNVRKQLNIEPVDTFYAPLSQAPSGLMTFLVRSPLEPGELSQRIREVAYRIDAEQPVESFRPFDLVRAESLAPPRLMSVLLSLFAALALVITCAGLAGVIAFSVGQRTQEIGIRVALGARPAAVIWLVVRQGVLMILAGILLGLGGSVWLSRLMAGLLYNVQTTDAVTFISVSLVLVSVAGFACFLPARRATRVDPLAALRFE